MTTLTKPAHGQPCNGCGVCCKAIPCPIAMEVLDATEGACPALEWDSEAGRYWCGLIRNASQHVPALNGKPWADPVMREMILETGAFGRACDSDD
jgi:hypothetical protein